MYETSWEGVQNCKLTVNLTAPSLSPPSLHPLSSLSTLPLSSLSTPSLLPLYTLSPPLS